MKAPEHVVALEGGDQLLRRCVLEREGLVLFRTLVNNAVDPAVLLVAQLSLVGVTLAGLPSRRRRVMLHDVVVPVDHPNLAVGPDLGQDGRGPLVSAGEQVPGVLRAEARAVGLDLKRGEQVAGRLSHECRAVPVLPWTAARRVKRMAGPGREMAVPVNLADLLG